MCGNPVFNFLRKCEMVPRTVVLKNLFRFTDYLDEYARGFLS